MCSSDLGEKHQRHGRGGVNSVRDTKDMHGRGGANRVRNTVDMTRKGGAVQACVEFCEQT